MWDKVGPRNWHRPLLLAPDNFTPASRTPWGGRRIAEDLKADAGLITRGPVGEAWELSVEPDFPSKLVDGPDLDETLRANPSLLGKEAPLGSTALLVKLIDAAEDLSVQIHPADEDSELAEDESGKPEAWYVIDAEPGAGLYLGFRKAVSRRDVEAAIDEGGALDTLMSFVPVSSGDLFLIEPGTPHAVGKGVLLLEPQRVAPAKRGVTYRYWDWNRRYDAEGRLDSQGRPRALHRERALDVTAWDRPREQALLEQIHYRAGTPRIGAPAKTETLIAEEGPLRSPVFVLRRLSGSGRLELEPENRLRSLTVLEGRVRLDDGTNSVELSRGRTAALPASREPLEVELDAAHAVLCGLT